MLRQEHERSTAGFIWSPDVITQLLQFTVPLHSKHVKQTLKLDFGLTDGKVIQWTKINTNLSRWREEWEIYSQIKTNAKMSDLGSCLLR